VDSLPPNIFLSFISISLSILIAKILKKFKFQFTLFDNDTAGKKASITYKKDYNTIPLLFPKGEPKDFSDNLLKYGERDVNDMMIDFVSSQGFFL
jgi:hypothetical protein